MADPSLRTKRDIERATKVRLRGLRASVEVQGTLITGWHEADDMDWLTGRARHPWRVRNPPRCIRVTLQRRTAYPPHGVLVISGCSEDVEPGCKDLRRATEAALAALDEAERLGHGHVEVRALMCACGGVKLDWTRCPLHRHGGLLNPASGAVGLLEFTALRPVREGQMVTTDDVFRS